VPFREDPCHGQAGALPAAQRVDRLEDVVPPESKTRQERSHLSLRQLGRCGQDYVQQALPCPEPCPLVLGVIAGRHPVSHNPNASLDLFRSDENPQQGGLTCPVRAHHGDALPPFHVHADIFEENPSGKGLGHVHQLDEYPGRSRRDADREVDLLFLLHGRRNPLDLAQLAEAALCLPGPVLPDPVLGHPVFYTFELRLLCFIVGSSFFISFHLFFYIF